MDTLADKCRNVYKSTWYKGYDCKIVSCIKYLIETNL